MKIKIIYFVIFVLIVIGLSIYGYFAAIPGVEMQTEIKPKIEIVPASFDFGNVKYGDVAEHVFQVKNLGQVALEIKRIATSCACTTAKISKETISPNEEVQLIVTYNTSLMSGAHAKGKQERIIYIKSNDPINPQIEAVITAYVN